MRLLAAPSPSALARSKARLRAFRCKRSHNVNSYSRCALLQVFVALEIGLTNQRECGDFISLQRHPGASCTSRVSGELFGSSWAASESKSVVATDIPIPIDDDLCHPELRSIFQPFCTRLGTLSAQLVLGAIRSTRGLRFRQLRHPRSHLASDVSI